MNAPVSTHAPLSAFPPLSRSQAIIRRKVDGTPVTAIEFLQRIAMDIEPERVRRRDPKAADFSMQLQVMTARWENGRSAPGADLSDHHFDNIARKMENVYFSVLMDCRLEHLLWDHARNCPRSNVNTDDVIKQLDGATKMRLATAIRDKYPEEHINERIFKINLVARYLLDTL